MNRALPEMLHPLNATGNVTCNGFGDDMSVLERQQARMKWQQQQQLSYFGGSDQLGLFSLPVQAQLQGLLGNDQSLGDLVNGSLKLDPDMDGCWTGFGDGFGYNGSVFDMNYGISRTASCPPAVAAGMAEVAVANGKGKGTVQTDKLNSSAGRESFKKRKADKNQNLKAVAEEETKDKKMKGHPEEGDSKVAEQNIDDKKTPTNTNEDTNKIVNTNTNKDNNSNKIETSTDTSKEKSKVTEVQKPDYIHVRARRGQATDSHSLAERVRREKISERMKYLQDLVPGCNKITGKAGMLDEIINYVQSLQRQVEFLSMKLASVNPRLDLDIDNFFAKEMFPACTSNFSPVSSEAANSMQLQFNSLHEVAPRCGLEMCVNPADMTLRRTISAPVSETLLDSSSLNQIQALSAWDAELQSLYNMEFQQDRSTSFLPQPFTGCIEPGNVKMEM